ncbi:MAG TPA: DUF4272 domain-containing protein [Labilithrix sp.]|nr:DUF4272 domain-containing protein [Labilithrix sp.]
MTRNARKARSIARLGAAKIKTSVHLPAITPPPLRKRLGVKAVRRRCLVLSGIQSVPNGRDPREVARWLRAEDLWDATSRSERAFLTKKRSPADLDAMSWRAEALWALWWALGYVHELSFPPRSCDLGDVLDRPGVDVPWIGSSTRAFVRSGGALRARDDLLDEADLAYRLHWAVREAQLGRGRLPRSVDPDVVEERHRALNWLLGRHASADWDDVDTPT